MPRGISIFLLLSHKYQSFRLTVCLYLKKVSITVAGPLTISLSELGYSYIKLGCYFVPPGGSNVVRTKIASVFGGTTPLSTEPSLFKRCGILRHLLQEIKCKLTFVLRKSGAKNFSPAF